MELKKNPKADLEKRRGLYLEIGLVVILGASLLAFNWKTYDKEESTGFQREVVDEPEEMVIQTDIQEPPPPPPPETPEVTTVIEVVSDDKEDIKEVSFNAEVDENTKNIEIAPVQIEEEEDETETQIFTVVENDPEFPGGMEALYTYLAQNIKYPQLARDNNITGRVYVTFVVERDGSITGCKVLRDIGGGCGAEAVRVVKSMPRWKPARQGNKPVRMRYVLPVMFRLS